MLFVLSVALVKEDLAKMSEGVAPCDENAAHLNAKWCNFSTRKEMASG